MKDRHVREQGQTLFQSAANIQRSMDDIDAMLEELYELLTSHRSGLGKVEWRDHELAVPPKAEGWFQHAYASTLNVSDDTDNRPEGKKGRKPKPIPLGTITIVARLCNSRPQGEHTPPWPWLNEACLIVGWHKGVENWFLIENFEAVEENTVEHIGNGLWTRKEDTTDQALFFVLPLFALENKTDLERMILHPLSQLFRAHDPTLEAANALAGVPVLTTATRHF